jgi:hypothetical protein
MKKGFFTGLAIFLVAVSVVQAGELHGWIGAEFGTKYVWRGFDVYDDHAAIHPMVNVDLFGTGFGINATGHRANSSGFENAERWDYNVYYQNMLFGDEDYATAYRIGWVYYNYPEIKNEWADLQEMHAIFSLPKILQVKGLVPTYVLVKLWPSSSEALVSKMVDLSTGMPSSGTPSGFAHILMLDYNMDITCPLTNQPSVLKLHSEVVFNDGVGPAGQNVDHDWSNAVFGISTDFNFGKDICITPAINYQSSWEDSVNPEDECWATVSAIYKF